LTKDKIILISSDTKQILSIVSFALIFYTAQELEIFGIQHLCSRSTFTINKKNCIELQNCGKL